MKRMSKWLVIVLAALLILSFAACKKEETAEPADKTTEVQATETVTSTTEEETTEETTTEEEDGINKGGVLQIVSGVPNNVIGYPIAGGTMEQFLAVPAIESLGRYDADGNIEGWLAKEINVDPETLTVVINLNEGISYTDGTPFNAQAVCDVWQIYIDNGYASKFSNVASFEATDEYEVTVNLTDWRTNVLTSLCIEAGMMISPTKFNEVGLEALYTDIVGTGAFIMEQYNVDEGIVYTRNDNYWIEGQPYLDGIEFIYSGDSSTSSNILRSGGANVAISLDNKTASELIEAGVTNLTKDTMISPTLNGVFFASGNEDDPMGKLEVRQAFCYAVDTDAINEAFAYGNGIVTNQIAVPGTKEFSDEVNGYPYDVEKAKELLAQAGYAEGECTITLTYMTGSDDLFIALYEMLTDAGFNVEFDIVDPSVYGDRIVVGRPAPFQSVTQWFAPTKVENWFRYFSANPSTMVVNCIDLEEAGVIAAYDACMTATSDEAQKEATDNLAKLIIDQYCLACPIYASLNLYVSDGTVQDSDIGEYWLVQWAPEKTWIE